MQDDVKQQFELHAEEFKKREAELRKKKFIPDEEVLKKFTDQGLKRLKERRANHLPNQAHEKIDKMFGEWKNLMFMLIPTAIMVVQMASASALRHF